MTNYVHTFQIIMEIFWNVSVLFILFTIYILVLFIFYLYQLYQWYLCYNILFICLAMQREYMNYVGSRIIEYVSMYHKNNK